MPWRAAILLGLVCGSCGTEPRRLHFPTFNRWELVKPPESNAPETVIDVRAGVPYVRLNIHASTGLGTDASAVRILLVLADADGDADCQPGHGHGVPHITSADSLGTPLDGHTPALAPAQLQLNSWADVRFPYAGTFEICYFSGVQWHHMPEDFTVTGVHSNTLSFWCQSDPFESCQILLHGSGLRMHWWSTLINHTSTCGQTPLQRPLGNQVARVTPKESGDMLHNFGPQFFDNAETYKVCFCPGFSLDLRKGFPCTQQEDFVQSIGFLYTTRVHLPYKIYHLVFSDLIVHCGSPDRPGCGLTKDLRIRLVDPSEFNDEPIFSDTNGCRTAQESLLYRHPNNCQDGPTKCIFEPNDLTGTAPKWRGIQISPSVENRAQKPVDFDVCFCPGSCSVPQNWFKADRISTNSIRVLPERMLAGLLTDFKLYGPNGGWNMAGDRHSRELKLLFDPQGRLRTSDCFGHPQDSRSISGHYCYNVHDCKPPTLSSESGHVWKDMKVLYSGMYAVCYCDKFCGEANQWSYLKWHLVAGPYTGQSWEFSRGVAFNMVFRGWGLRRSDRVRIVASKHHCGDPDAMPTEGVHIPDGTPHQQGDISGTDVQRLFYSYDGTLITTRKPHGLAREDYISLSNVTSPQCAQCAEVYNSQPQQVIRLANEYQFVVPVDFNKAAFPVLEPAGVNWVVSSQVMYTLITASIPGTYRVCWGGDYPSAARDFAADAGLLSIYEPPVLETHLHILSSQSGVLAPAVIAFETRHDRKYTETMGSMQLKIVFKDTMQFAPGVTFSPQERSVSISGARQHICGRIFKELWSSDDDGFPMPKGCYYDHLRKEYSIVFSPKNGLKGGTSYQVVMDARAFIRTNTRDAVLQLMSMEDVDLQPFGVVEVGQASPTTEVMAEAESPDARLHVLDGLRITGSAAEIELFYESNWEVPIELRAAAGTQIRKGSVFKLFLYPLTQWHLEQACLVDCRPGRESLRCDDPLCSTEAVVPTGLGSKRNILKLIFSEMDPISDLDRHIFVLSRLSLPPGGFFADRLSGELNTVSGKAPSFTTSVGALVFAKPSALGSVVSASGDGEYSPFRGDQSNILYARLVLGASLWAAENGDAQFKLQLPTGYRCVHAETAEDNLHVLASKAPQGRGEVGLDIALDGYWLLSGSNCVYVLRRNGIVYAGSSIFVKLWVNNPSFALTRPDSRNTWTILLHGQGAPGVSDSQVPKDGRVSAFVDRTENLRKNVPVLGKLRGATLTPSLFGAGQDRNWLSVFFTTEQDSPDVGPRIRLQAPEGFGFTPRCIVEALPEYHYATMSSHRTGVTSQTLPLSVVHCEATRAHPEASHRSVVTMTLSRFAQWKASTTYGFRIMAFNSEMYTPEQHNSFRLHTFSAEGDGLDATEDTLAFLTYEDGSGNPATSFGVYRLPMLPGSFVIGIENMLPYSETGVRTRIIIFPIVVPFVTRSNVDWRIVAPHGYEWDFLEEEFLYRRQDLMGATADLPIAQKPSAPALPPKNVLAFEDNFNGLWIQVERYGLIARIRIPDETPRSSVNAFFIEFGYNARTFDQRYAAGYYEAPQVRAVVNALVDYEITNLAGRQNRLIFQLQTITNLRTGGALVLDAPAGFVFDQSCAVMSNPVRTEPFQDLRTAASMLCIGQVDMSTKRPFITISVMRGEAQAAQYEFLMDVQNPTTPQSAVGMTWHFRTYANLAQGHAADMAALVPGFPIDVPMSDAEIVSTVDFMVTGRDDHPLQRSSVMLAFELNTRPADTESILTVKAPLSFTFSPLCQVVVGANVFGPSQTYRASYSPFEPTASVTGCVGFRNTARITVKRGLLPFRRYAFRIEVYNPSVTPEENKWSLSFGGESASPFVGYRLWAFTEVRISASHLARSTLSSETRNLVSIHLRPSNTIPIEGVLSVTAPFGFRIPTTCSLQVHRLLSPGDQVVATLPPLKCMGTAQPGNSAELHVVLEASKMLALQLHRMDLEVVNPSVMPTDPGTWRFQSHLNKDEGYSSLLDVGEARGFLVSEVFHEFSVAYPSYVGSLEDRLALEVRVVLPDAVLVGDALEIRGPVGYDFTAPNSEVLTSGQLRTCRNFIRFTPEELPDPGCMGNLVRFAFQAEGIALDPLAKLTPVLRFGVQSVYPRRTLDALVNVFQGEHRRHEQLLSSKTTPGRSMTPRLLGLTVTRMDSKVSVQSLSSIRVTFTPSQRAEALHVATEAAQGETHDGGGQFVFSQVTVAIAIDGQDQPLTTLIRGNGTLILELNLQESASYVLTIEDVINPSRPGVAFWTLTTFAKPVLGAQVVPMNLQEWLTTENRRDHSENFAGPETQSRIEMDLAETVLSTPYFDASAAELFVSFHVRPVAIHAGSYLLLKAPVGYTFVDRSFRPGDGFPLVSSSVFARAPTSDGDHWTYVVQIQTQIQAGQAIKFALNVDTPRTPEDLALWESQHLNTWLFVAAEDPEGSKPTASNDRHFPGFQLLGSFGTVLVTPEPNGVTPRKRVTIALDMEPKGALRSLLEGGSVHLRVTAPLGFDFDSGCLAVTPHAVFTECTGYGRIAVLPVLDALLPSGRTQVMVWVTNAAITPTYNWWVLESFLDMTAAETQLAPASGARQKSAVEGYAVREMLQATVGGNPERGAVTNVLIWFLAGHFLDVGGTLELHAPAGYELRCTPGVNFITLPPCSCRLKKGVIATTGDAYHNYLVLTLVMSTHLVYPNAAYEFSVSAVNPLVLPSPNYWGLILFNLRKEVVDASMNLGGYPLSNYGLYIHSLLPTTTMPAVVCYVTLTMSFQRQLAAGLVGHITIRAPTTTKVLCQRFADLSGGGGAGGQLPLDQTAGMFGTHSCRLQNAITLHVLQSQPLRALTHLLQIGVLNPGLRAQKDHWTVELLPPIVSNSSGQSWYNIRPLLEVQVQGFGISTVWHGGTVKPYSVDAAPRVGRHYFLSAFLSLLSLLV